MSISAVILTKNEEENIKECIKNLAWCDEIIIVDDYSTDKTIELTKKGIAKIYRRKLNGDFASQRNFGLRKAQGNWVLFIDADERVSPALAEEIRRSINKNREDEVVGFYLKRKDVLWGKMLHFGEQGDVRLLRLAKKNSGWWRRRVHEVWEIQGKTAKLKNPLLHYPHQSLAEFIQDVDFYSTLHAQANKDEGKSSNFLKVLLYPLLKFIQNWLFKFGFLDGTAGFVAASMMSFHSFLAWSKLYLAKKSRGKL
jgi:glycosyltransferase involved in cell wall biosynthesis